MARSRKKKDVEAPAPPPEVDTPSLPNHDREAMKDFIDRWTGVELTRLEVLREGADQVKDIKTEIKAASAEKGLDVAEIGRLVKIRVEESEARRKAEQARGDLVTYEALYGKADPLDDDPLA